MFLSEFSAFYQFAYIINTYLYWLLISLFLFITGSLCFHTLNGLRHLLWDLTFGLELKNVIFSGLFILTIIIVYILFILS
jgi:succinate dehydrogenase cytochrome b556 subunit